MASGEVVGTHLRSEQAKILAKKQWMADHLRVSGELHLDAGAVKVLRTDGKSLLPVGVVNIEGSFERGDVVACLDPQGKIIARGLVNYSSAETARIMRQPSSEIASILGYVDEAELIHRDNLIIL
jgi:glutamate 5-kinase